jgi:RNA polymerase primary sigma factor
LESRVRSEENGLILEETITVEGSLPTSDQITNKILRQLLIEAIEKLPPRHANIILLRYGFKDGHQYTLEEIGQRYGVTREWVRQIEAWSINKLRGRFPRLADFL